MSDGPGDPIPAGSVSSDYTIYEDGSIEQNLPVATGTFDALAHLYALWPGWVPGSAVKEEEILQAYLSGSRGQ